MRYFSFLLLLVLSTLLILINRKLFSTPVHQVIDKADVILELNYLERQLKEEDLAEKMQGVFPEGVVFVNALYGLAWCELALAQEEQGPAIKARVLKEALYAYDQVCSEQAKEHFDPYLPIDYGIFYAGWRNYLLSKILQVDTSFTNHSFYIQEFKEQSHLIAQVMKETKSPFLESYFEQAWPADMCVAVASLRGHDQVFAPRYSGLIKQWVQKVEARVDPKTGMIPHKVEKATGKSIESSRGGSMALMLRLLREINPAFAQKQYHLFKDKFVSTALTFPCIREYPKGSFGIGDIDSGPVILGVGFPATLVAVGCLPMFGDQALAAKQYITVNAFGLEQVNEEEKYYLFGALPMADAFIAWSRATGMHYKDENMTSTADLSTVKFHLISLSTIVLMWGIYYRKAIIKLFQNRASSI